MNLEDRLRDTLIDDRLALPSWPDATTRVRAGVRRRRQRRATVAAATAGVAVAAVFSAAPMLTHANRATQLTGSPATTGSALPGLGQPVDPGSVSPSESASASQSPGATARSCTAGDLSPTAKAGPATGAGGHTLNVVRLTNGSSSTCTLAGFPDLIATDAGTGTRTSLHPKQGTYFDAASGKRYPATIKPGEDASVDIETASGCNGGMGQPQRYRDVALVVAGRQYPVPGLSLQTWCPVAVGAWYTVE